MRCEGELPRRKHHDLIVWQEAIRLVERVYSVSEPFPSYELYGLTSQIRRAAVSIPSNIAEGAARTSKKEFLHFLSISRGSLSELETQVIISSRLGYINSTDEIMAQINKVFALLGGLIKSLNNGVDK